MIAKCPSISLLSCYANFSMLFSVSIILSSDCRVFTFTVLYLYLSIFCLNVLTVWSDSYAFWILFEMLSDWLPSWWPSCWEVFSIWCLYFYIIVDELQIYKHVMYIQIVFCYFVFVQIYHSSTYHFEIPTNRLLVRSVWKFCNRYLCIYLVQLLHHL